MQRIAEHKDSLRLLTQSASYDPRRYIIMRELKTTRLYKKRQ
jgi:hypothetical protein